MSVLLLRLAGPLQAWGGPCKFNRRLTEREPTKSGVIGLAAAALGRRRTDPLDDLTGLSFGVRTDQTGRLLQDYHTASTEADKRKRKTTFTSTRHYLADAVFLAGLEGDDELLRRLDLALGHPMFPLFLGRRSCPPAGRVSLGLRPGSLLETLTSEPWQAADWYRRKAPARVELEIVQDAPFGAPGSFVRRDQALSFSREHRRHAFRSLTANSRRAVLDNPAARGGGARGGFSEPATRHDPLAALEDADVSVKD